MQDLTDKEQIFEYHKLMMRVHKNVDHRAQGWLTLEGQLRRFQVLSEIADLNNCTVMDAGCGHADLFPFLKSLFPHVCYIGVDQIPEFLKLAKKRYGRRDEAKFYLEDFITGDLPQVDYALACGSLNYHNSDPDFIFKAINKLFSLSRLGTGFNLLRRTASEGTLSAYDSAQIEAYCKTLARKVRLLDDYDEEDFTLFMYR